MVGRRGESEREWLALVDWIAKRTGTPPEEVPPKVGESRVLNPSEPWVSDARLMRDLIDLRALKAKLEAEAAPPPAPDAPRPPSRADELYARRRELASEFLAWYRLHPEAGELGGRSGLIGTAFGTWPRGVGIPADVRHAVAKEAYAMHAAAAPPEPADKSAPHAFKASDVMRSRADKSPLCHWCDRRGDDPIHQARRADVVPLDLFRAAAGGDA
jgi:hypothetical protein